MDKLVQENDSLKNEQINNYRWSTSHIKKAENISISTRLNEQNNNRINGLPNRLSSSDIRFSCTMGRTLTSLFVNLKQQLIQTDYSQFRTDFSKKNSHILISYIFWSRSNSNFRSRSHVFGQFPWSSAGRCIVR